MIVSRATLTESLSSIQRCLSDGSMRQGWVYCIRDDVSAAVKIGFSENPARRLSQIQTSSATRLRMVGAIQTARAFERYLHLENARRRLTGEWFDDADEHLSALFNSFSLGVGSGDLCDADGLHDDDRDEIVARLRNTARALMDRADALEAEGQMVGAA